MRPRDALRRASELLRAAAVESHQHDAEELLAHVLRVPRTMLGLVVDLDPEQQADYDALVARRARREPLQHLTGVAGFRHVEVAVGPGVFVPRPETELLAGWAVDVLADLTEPTVVDLCTGSGAIALALSHEVPAAHVHAVEVSPQAHAWAERNLAGSGVDLRLGDISRACADLAGAVDVVVANPPYIPLGCFESVAAEVRDFDPPLALWSGEDGLDAIRTVEGVAATLLRPGGRVGCEHADLQGESAPAIFAAALRWVDVQDHRDLADRPRYVTARRR